MDANDVKPPQESKSAPTMQEMMERMCCSGEFSPADMCRRMMRSKGKTDEAHRDCCGPPSRAP